MHASKSGLLKPVSMPQEGGRAFRFRFKMAGESC
jgi:hypothetical protein